MLLNIQSEQKLLLEQQKTRLMEADISVMLSQIQPHFLFNSLTCICQLCDTEPARESEALEHFFCFLRGNVDSLSNRGLIPFEREMVHVRDYYDKLDGLENRRKLRLRTYSPNAPGVKLEIKEKSGNCQRQRSLTVTREQARSMAKGCFSPLSQIGGPFGVLPIYLR